MDRRLHDPATLAYALDSVYAEITYPQQVAEWRATADELVQAAEAATTRSGVPPGVHGLGVLMLEGEEMLEGVDAQLQAMEQLSNELGQPAQTWALSVTQAARACSPVNSRTPRQGIDQRFRELRGTAAPNSQTSRSSVPQVLQQFVLRRERAASWRKWESCGLDKYPD